MIQRNAASFHGLHHHSHEAGVVDLAASLRIRLVHETLGLLVSELIAEVREDVPQLDGGDEALAVLVERSERGDQLLLGLGPLHFPAHVPGTQSERARVKNKRKKQNGARRVYVLHPAFAINEASRCTIMSDTDALNNIF